MRLEYKILSFRESTLFFRGWTCLLFILGELLSQFFKHTKLPCHFGSSKPTGAKLQTDKTKRLHEQNLEASDATTEFEQFLWFWSRQPWPGGQRFFFWGGFGKVSRGWKKTYFSGGENGKLTWYVSFFGGDDSRMVMDDPKIWQQTSVWLFFGRFSKGVFLHVAFHFFSAKEECIQSDIQSKDSNGLGKKNEKHRNYPIDSCFGLPLNRKWIKNVNISNHRTSSVLKNSKVLLCHVLKAYFMWTNNFDPRRNIPVFWTGIHKSSEIA